MKQGVFCKNRGSHAQPPRRDLYTGFILCYMIFLIPFNSRTVCYSQSNREIGAKYADL